MLVQFSLAGLAYLFLEKSKESWCRKGYCWWTFAILDQSHHSAARLSWCSWWYSLSLSLCICVCVCVWKRERVCVHQRLHLLSSPMLAALNYLIMRCISLQCNFTSLIFTQFLLFSSYIFCYISSIFHLSKFRKQLFSMIYIQREKSVTKFCCL